MTRLAFLSALATAIAAAGCGANAFSPHFPDNTLPELKRSLEGVKTSLDATPQNSTGRPMVFVVTQAPTRILAFDLASRSIAWTVAANVSSRIVVGKSKLFHGEGEKTIVARNVADGSQAWSAPLEGGDRLLGAATDGEDLFYVAERLERTSGGDIATLVAVDGDGGGTRWSVGSSGRLGAPAAVPGRVFVPLRFQSVSVLDASNGSELARVRSKEETVLWARPSSAGVLFGGKNGVYKLDDRAVAGTAKGSTFVAAPLPKSVRPVYWWDGYNASLAAYTAYDRNRLLWHLAPEGARFQGDAIFVHNYRFFFAFDTAQKDASRSALRWAYGFPRHDVVASDHTGKALVLVTDHGHLIVLDPEAGVPVLQHQLKVNVRGASFDAAGYAPPARTGARPDLRRSLTEIIWDPDRRFGAVKLFCVEELSRLSGGDVARDLVKIVTFEEIDPAVYRQAGQVIVARHDKKAIPLYLETLKSHFSFVEGTRAKAVDIMAQALGDLKAGAAVKPLLKHLADHETPVSAVEQIVRALAAIGDKSVLEPFRDFLLTYRCDPMFSKAPAALNLVAETLLKLGGEDERQLLSFVENDPHTLLSLRNYLGEALRQTKPEPAKTSKP